MELGLNESAPVVIVGGGPAGMVAGLLFARAGVRVIILEKHADFLRDFRGDTVHPSTMEILHELGLLERFLVLGYGIVRPFGDRAGCRAAALAAAENISWWLSASPSRSKLRRLPHRR